jgi:hypothetical protein
MEFIECDGGILKVVKDTGDKGWRHVDAGPLDLLFLTPFLL